ncbi:MAG: glycosyltransferase 87 family protein [Acidobacteriota bacterium]|nr:glycosyltransferase 87 family protein [Acidobacteriota bacterium]
MNRARVPLAVIAAIAIAGFVVRALAMRGPGGVNAIPSGYDDGVYFAASALLTRGVLPYRDFVFVHPPGVLYFFAPVAWMADVARGFAAAHGMAMIVGAINVALAGVIALRAGGALAGIVAALLYAFYPDAVVVERSAFLEPVLNLTALLSAFVWLRDDDNRRPWLAGALCGAACAVKFWGGIWLIAAIASAARARFRTDVPRFAGGAAIAGLLLVAPVALPAPLQFLEQTLRFQVSRPPDGTIGALARLPEILGAGHRAATVLMIVALLAMFVRIRRGITRDERFFATAVAVTIAGFAASSSYWTQYNSHLAASQCVLAGIGAASLLRIRRVPRALAVVAVALLIIVLDASSMREVVRGARARATDILVSARAIHELVPANASVFAFEPAWALAAGRLPPHDDRAPVIVDSYGAMLLHAALGGRKFVDTGAAFQNADTHPQLRARLAATPYALLGWRGNWQMNGADRAWFAARFACINPEAGDLCVWQRVERAGKTRGAQTIAYGEGWYGEEGVPPDTWRWTAARAVTSLPSSRSGARLTLRMHVPLDSLLQPPAITIEADGRVLDRFTAASNEVEKTYELAPGSDAPLLVITTSQTFVPAQGGASGDTRELGLRVAPIVWRRR